LRTEHICREFLERNPGSVDHLRLLGNALGRQARYAEAEQAVRRAISLKPDYPHLHEDLGSVLALQERYAEAVPCLEQAIRLEPQLPHSLAALRHAAPEAPPFSGNGDYVWNGLANDGRASVRPLAHRRVSQYAPPRDDRSRPSTTESV
jgi:tetratricopeptide (TPR) repeat protein